MAAAVPAIKKLQRCERIHGREEYCPVVTYKIKVKECASSSSSPPPSPILSISSTCSLPLVASGSKALAELTDSIAHLEKLSTSLHQAGTRGFPLRTPLKLGREYQSTPPADEPWDSESSSTGPCCEPQHEAQEEIEVRRSGGGRWKSPWTLQRRREEAVMLEISDEEEGMWALFPWKLELHKAGEEEKHEGTGGEEEGVGGGLRMEAGSGVSMQLQAGRAVHERELAKKEEEEEASLSKTKEKRKEWEVGKVECECCGIEEECTRGYEERVRRGLCGHWLCGLCEEAVREELKRLGGRAAGGEVSLQAALQAHMQPCRGFSSRARAKASPPPSAVAVPHAVCRLLRRHLSSPAPSPRPGPSLPRCSSCLPSFHRMHHHPQ